VNHGGEVNLIIHDFPEFSARSFVLETQERGRIPDPMLEGHKDGYAPREEFGVQVFLRLNQSLFFLLVQME
jgi:hypothetical protein